MIQYSQLKLDIDADDKFFNMELDPGEPVFPIRGHDKFAIEALTNYATLCLREGLMDQASKALAFIKEIKVWQAHNIGLLKYPD